MRIVGLLFSILFFTLSYSSKASTWQDNYDAALNTLHLKETSWPLQNKAIQQGLKALSLLETEPPSKKLAKHYMQVGQLLVRLGHSEGASQAFLNYLNLIHLQEGKESLDYLMGMKELTRCKLMFYRIKSIPVLVNQYHELSLNAQGKSGDHYLSSLLYLGDFNFIIDQYEDAEAYYSKALELVEQKGKDSPQYLRTVVHMAKLYTTLGRFAEAEVLLRKGKASLSPINTVDTIDIIDLHLQFAALESKLDNQKKTKQLLYLAESYCSGHIGYQHPLFIHLVCHQLILSPSKKKADFLTNTVSKNIKEPFLSVFVSIALAQYHLHQEQYQEGIDRLKSSLEYLQKHFGTNHYLNTLCLHALADSYHHQGESKKGIQYLKTSIKIQKKILSITHTEYLQSIADLSIMYWSAGDIPQAHRFFNHASERYIHYYHQNFVFLSEIEKQLFYENIRGFFEKFNSFVVAHYQQIPDLIDESFDHQLVSKGLLFNTTRELREEIFRKQDLFHQYNAYIQTRELLSRAYNIKDRQVLVDHHINIDSLENMANLQEKELSFKIEQSKSMEERLQTIENYYIDWKTVRQELSAEEAAVELIRNRKFSPHFGGQFSDSIFYLALIMDKKTKKHPHLVSLTDGTFLENSAVKKYRNCIRFLLKDKKSYHRFWAPIANNIALKNKKKVYISTDGVYNQLNLNTLLKPDHSYVLDDYDIHLISNIKDIITLKTDDKFTLQTQSSLLIGYPNYTKIKVKELEVMYDSLHPQFQHHSTHRAIDLTNLLDIEELPGTKREILQIDTIMKRHQQHATIKLNNEADEEVLKATMNKVISPSIIHIATHGYFNKSDTSSAHNGLRQTGLLLSGAAYSNTDIMTEKTIEAWNNNIHLDDGNLSAFEAMNLNLFNTDLVILSACETGLGVIKGGEGVYGLQRAFQTAGAKTVVISLWKVSDQATQEFMALFYEKYFELNDKKAAFRATRLAFRTSYPKAFFWGAFIMIGE